MHNYRMHTAQYTPSFCFTSMQMLEIATLQYAANDNMAEDWTQQDRMSIPFFRASYIEAVEAIEHMGFKWWKKKVPDYSQAKMELIDILHFAVSDLLRESAFSIGQAALIAEDSRSYPVTFYHIGRMAGFEHMGTPSEPTLDGEILATKLPGSENYRIHDIQNMDFNDLCEQLIFSSLMDGVTKIRILYCLFERLEMEADEVHALFVGKNALNQFRTANGQKKDDYSKIWDGREDNEHLSEFIEENLRTGPPLKYADVLRTCGLGYPEI